MATPYPNLDEIYGPTTTIPESKKDVPSSSPSAIARTQYLRGFGHESEPVAVEERSDKQHTKHTNSMRDKIRETMKLRLKYFCHHVRWICRNIVNLEALESRKDLVVFKSKSIKYLWHYAESILKTVDQLKFDTIVIGPKPYMADILKLLHALESVLTREYVAPILSIGYLKHIQGMGALLLEPHWMIEMLETNGHTSIALHEQQSQKYMFQELSQYVLPVYYNLSTLLHLLDIDLHNPLFYQTMSLLQKYHNLSSARSTDSFYDQHMPFLDDAMNAFELVQEMVRSQTPSTSTLPIPKTVATLWVHEVRLAINMFSLYKDQL